MSDYERALCNMDQSPLNISLLLNFCESYWRKDETSARLGVKESIINTFDARKNQKYHRKDSPDTNSLILTDAVFRIFDWCLSLQSSDRIAAFRKLSDIIGYSATDDIYVLLLEIFSILPSFFITKQ